MPLVFANPALLLGALAAAVPVIIHFLSRRKVQRKKFSDLRFLDEVQAKQARSLGIRRWLLLLLRVLAILLIALAFGHASSVVARRVRTKMIMPSKSSTSRIRVRASSLLRPNSDAPPG